MNNLKHNLEENKLTIGSWLSIANPVVCEMMCNANFDWLVIDMEHTSITSSDMLQMIQIISLSNITPIVRVGANDVLLIKKAMDCGATGVIVPMVNTKQDAIDAVNAVYYPPFGKRGVGLFRAQNYGEGFAKYLDTYKDNTTLIVQIEHYLGVEDIDEILDVPGVDGFIVGPYDLSASLGVPGEFDHPKVAQYLKILENKIKEGGVTGGVHVVHSDIDKLQSKIKDGYKFIAYGDDMLFLSEKLSLISEQLCEFKEWQLLNE
jgi:2-keto-3-deoxy-L-rhamnonate aldolase RhmA